MLLDHSSHSANGSLLSTLLLLLEISRLLRLGSGVVGNNSYWERISSESSGLSTAPAAKTATSATADAVDIMRAVRNRTACHGAVLRLIDDHSARCLSPFEQRTPPSASAWPSSLRTTSSRWLTARCAAHVPHESQTWLHFFSLFLSLQQYDLADFDEIILLGAGKASAQMGEAVISIVGEERVSKGHIVTKYDHTMVRPLSHCRRV